MSENKECDGFVFVYFKCKQCPKYIECEFNPDNDNTLEELKNLRESIKLYNNEKIKYQLHLDHLKLGGDKAV